MSNLKKFLGAHKSQIAMTIGGICVVSGYSVVLGYGSALRIQNITSLHRHVAIEILKSIQQESFYVMPNGRELIFRTQSGRVVVLRGQEFRTMGHDGIIDYANNWISKNTIFKV
jgi:hypothetical protein